MNRTTDELVSTLTQQPFRTSKEEDDLLADYMRHAESYVKIDSSIVILSDFRTNKCYIYAGAFGAAFGLPAAELVVESAFEDCIFSKVHPDDLNARHLLELNYFRFQQGNPVPARPRYSTVCHIRIQDVDGRYRRVTHRTCYVASHPNGSVWLALCFYAPATASADCLGIGGRIMDNVTGDVLLDEASRHYDRNSLTRREADVLRLLAKGRASKEIAAELHISLYTVYRHRQNILSKLRVANTAEAVRTAFVIGLI